MSWTSWLFYEFIEGKDFSRCWRIEIESERHRHLRRTENGRGGSARREPGEPRRAGFMSCIGDSWCWAALSMSLELRR